MATHEKNEGKPARIQGTLIIDQDNRLLPVKLEVTKLEIIEPAGKPKPASPEPGTQPRGNESILAPGSEMKVEQKYFLKTNNFTQSFNPMGT